METVGWTNWLALMLTKTVSATSMTPIHNLQPLQPVIGMVMAFLTTHSINPEVDRFPEDSTQWADSDNDGYGDNATGNEP